MLTDKDDIYDEIYLLVLRLSRCPRRERSDFPFEAKTSEWRASWPWVEVRRLIICQRVQRTTMIRKSRTDILLSENNNRTNKAVHTRHESTEVRPKA